MGDETTKKPEEKPEEKKKADAAPTTSAPAEDDVSTVEKAGTWIKNKYKEFKAADINKDGKADVEQFEQWVSKQAGNAGDVYTAAKEKMWEGGHKVADVIKEEGPDVMKALGDNKFGLMGGLVGMLMMMGLFEMGPIAGLIMGLLAFAAISALGGDGQNGLLSNLFNTQKDGEDKSKTTDKGHAKDKGDDDHAKGAAEKEKDKDGADKDKKAAAAKDKKGEKGRDKGDETPAGEAAAPDKQPEASTKKPRVVTAKHEEPAHPETHRNPAARRTDTPAPPAPSGAAEVAVADNAVTEFMVNKDGRATMEESEAVGIVRGTRQGSAFQIKEVAARDGNGQFNFQRVVANDDVATPRWAQLAVKNDALDLTNPGIQQSVKLAVDRAQFVEHDKVVAAQISKNAERLASLKKNPEFELVDKTPQGKDSALVTYKYTYVDEKDQIKSCKCHGLEKKDGALSKLIITSITPDGGQTKTIPPITVSEQDNKKNISNDRQPVYALKELNESTTSTGEMLVSAVNKANGKIEADEARLAAKEKEKAAPAKDTGKDTPQSMPEMLAMSSDFIKGGAEHVGNVVSNIGNNLFGGNRKR